MKYNKEKLELLANALNYEFDWCTDEYDYEFVLLYKAHNPIPMMKVEELLYKTLVYTNYVASLDDEIEPKSFIDFITSKEYYTDFEILTNHVIDTLVSEEEE